MGPRVTVVDGSRFVELNMDQDRRLEADALTQAVEYLRGLVGGGDVQLSGEGTDFARGQDLLDWAQDARHDLNEHEVRQ